MVVYQLISGGYNYLLKFITQGIVHYQELIVHYQELIEENIERDFGIAKYFSYIVLKSPMEKLHYPCVKLFNTDN